MTEQLRLRGTVRNMRLWQKVFLCALLLITLAINSTAFVVLKSSYDTIIANERDRAITQHTSFAAGISNKVVYERMLQGNHYLSEADVHQILSDTINASAESGYSMAVWSADGCVGQYQLSQPNETLRQAVTANEVASRICREADATRLHTGSIVTIEGVPYTVYTALDITDVEKDMNQRFWFVLIMSEVFALVIGGVLMLIVFRLLSPLDRVNRSIRRIAAGDYQRRLPEKGSYEFVQLSRNVNQMAVSIEQKIDEIQQLADGRQQFIDDFAHEMKTPLTSILGFADILRIQRNMTEEQRREYADVIVKEASRLRSLSNKLLELTVSEHTEPEREPLNIPAFFDEITPSICALLATRAQKPIIQPVEATLSADKTLLTSLLYNLIDNASKASSEGSEINLSCRVQADTIALSVSDHGIGMSQEAIRRVTEPFYMVDKSRSRKSGGAGLGLSLCRKIAEQHGATMTIDSTPNVGTTVTVAFPQREAAI